MEKDWAESQLATNSSVSIEMTSKYERGEDIPSLDAAKKIVKAFGVTLNYLAGGTSDMAFDRRTAERIQDIEQLDAFLAKKKMQAILK